MGWWAPSSIWVNKMWNLGLWRATLGGMRRSYFDLVLILAVAAVGAFLWHRPESKTEGPVVEKPGVKGLTLDGVRPGMTREQVQAVLGVAPAHGEIQVGSPVLMGGTWEEWGSKTLTWEGRPTVTYWPTGEVLSVAGKELKRDGQTLCKVGEEVQGPGLPVGDDGRYELKTAQGTVGYTIAMDNRVSRIVWSDGRATPPAYFNGVKPGDSLNDLEARLGPPDFRNPQASYQQWEKPLTQVKYDAQRNVIEVGGSGTGDLSRGGVVVLNCGEPEGRIVQMLGKPAKFTGTLYTYPDGLTIDCGSVQGQQRYISHIQLRNP